MLTRLEMTLSGDTHDISAQSGSIFHGALMEMVDTEYAEKLHKSELKPFHQYIEKDGDSVRWIICTLNDEAYGFIIRLFLEDQLKIIELKHKQVKLTIVGKKLESMDEQTLIDRTYLSKAPAYITIHFLTPTAFKRDGNYVFYPDVMLMVKSLMKKYDAFSPQTKVYDEETIKQLAEYTEITFYSLRSTTYAVKGNVNSFYGTITIKNTGPQMMKNLLLLLFQYGEFSGIGIKCALGMGAVKIGKERGRRVRQRN